jgi:prepilin signal peptidase PulO-like enzyme (type II secretory pathway)
MDLRSANARSATAERPGQLRPAVAVATFALVMLAFVQFGPSARALGAAFLICVVAALAIVDLEQRRIPNRIVLPATAVVLAAQIALNPRGTPELLAISLGAGLFFCLPMLVSPGGMGMGDVKLAFLLGAALGQAVVLAIAVAVLGRLRWHSGRFSPSAPSSRSSSAEAPTGRTRRIRAAGPDHANARYRWEVAPAGSWSYVCVAPGSSYHEYA